MTVVNPKSISGINSITTGSGSDNLLTIHTSDASSTERVRINSSGDVIVGSGITVSPDGDIFATGVCTATSFSGDGSALTGIAATDNVRTGILDVAGIATFRADAIFNADVRITDSIIHEGDTNTKIRFPGADTITVETAGVERARITSEGRLLIGKTSGTAKVDVDASDNTIRITKAAVSNYCGFQLDRDNSNNAGGYLGLSGSAGHYINNSVQHDLCLRSESKLLFSTSGNTERLRIGTEGNLALGGTNTSAYATQAHFFIGGVGDIYADTGVSSGKSLSITNNAYINTSGNWVYRATDKASNIYQYDGIIGFRTVASGTSGNTISWSEKFRIANDGTITNTGSNSAPTSGSGFGFTQDQLYLSTAGTGANYALRFYNDNGLVGSVLVNGSGVTYNTSSDYRLKENQVSISDGITRLKQLKPYRFNFKTDASTTVDGFLAHEAQSVVPESVSGTKDQVANADDVADGLASAVGDPVHQGIDQSKLVPLLTAALQEAVAKIEVLETRLNNAGIAT